MASAIFSWMLAARCSRCLRTVGWCVASGSNLGHFANLVASGVGCPRRPFLRGERRSARTVGAVEAGCEQRVVLPHHLLALAPAAHLDAFDTLRSQHEHAV